MKFFTIFVFPLLVSTCTYSKEPFHTQVVKELSMPLGAHALDSSASKEQSLVKPSPTSLIKLEDGLYASPSSPITISYPTYTFSPSTPQKKMNHQRLTYHHKCHVPNR